ncbi:MAG: SMC-Scp complex subunit ScpB [Lachnospiraceae bacterium]|nr:SMC-Scp complex subunit ScpB [Lachnospiraceae bacterium]
MEIKTLEAAVEALLFAMGEALPAKDIAQVLEQDVEDVRRLIRNMMSRYDEENRGIQIIELEDSFQLCTKPSMYEYLIRMTHQPRKHTLTDVALETLSIIAYKQPVTRAEIEKIRGVNSDHSINRLVEYNLVCEAGRLDAPGKPILFGTTEEFLRTFGVCSVEELPVLNPEKVEEFKMEAEEEVDLGIEEDS